MNKELIPSDYKSIKDKIIEKLVEKGYSADVLGSNANLLADVLAYTAYGINVNTSFQASEMLLNRAMFRKNILYGAKLLGYEANRKISYKYWLTIKPKLVEGLDPNDETKHTYSIPKYSVFESNDNKYHYLGGTLTQELSNKDITEGNFETHRIVVVEGDLLRYKDYPNEQIFTLGSTLDKEGNIIPDNLIKIYHNDIENDGLELFISYLDMKTGEEKKDEYWEKSDQFLIDADTNVNKKYFVLNNIEHQGVDVYFKISNIGNNLLPGTIIKVNILKSKGEKGEGNNIFKNKSPDFEFQEITKIELHTKGTTVESNESIKENAPIFHNSANRAVTARDYTAICNRQPNVLYSQIWGGDEEDVIRLGHIWFSFVPETKNSHFTFNADTNTYSLDDKMSHYIRETELRSSTLVGNTLVNKGIFDVLDTYKIMTMKLHYRHPIYIDFDYTIRVVKYNILESKEAINEKLFKIVEKYFKTNIENFNTTYFHASLIKLIAAELNDASGLQVNVEMNIPLYKFNKEPDSNMIYMYFALPFEQLQVVEINSIDKVKTDILPNLVSHDGTLTVDFSKDKGFLKKNKITDLEGFTVQTAKLTYPIMKNDLQIGEYTLDYQSQRRFILIKIEDEEFINSLQDDTPYMLKVKYPADNLNFYKNTLPRLSSVKFINENIVI